MDTAPVPTLDEIRSARKALGDRIRMTPVAPLDSPAVRSALGPGTRVTMKLEIFQVTGSFKPRGALVSMLEAPAGALERGVAAVSAGNHAIAVAYAAACLGVSAKVVMIESANPLRRRSAAAYGAEVLLARSIHDAFGRVEELVKEEGRVLIHPFEGPSVAKGTATLGAEFVDQVADLDAILVPIGGGGLAAGISTAVKALDPRIEVWGVEPAGADSMSRSFARNEPVKLDRVDTVADSLGAPYALPYSFDLCRRHLDGIAIVTDAQIIAAMGWMMEEARLSVEPAGAAALAGLLGPLRDRLSGRHAGLIVCGSNIDRRTYSDLLRRSFDGRDGMEENAAIGS